MCPLSSPRPAPTADPAGGLVTVDGRTFPLESAEIVARAEGGIARSQLTQRYTNPHEEALEAIYTMPLPADGAVIGYTITLGDRVIRGEIQRAREARRTYRRALEEGRTAGLLEQHRADTFSQKLGNLPAGADAVVEIEVLHPLAFRPQIDGRGPRWEYRFPTVTGVRYQGGPGRVPDAEDIDAPRADDSGTPARLKLDLVLAGGPRDGLNVESPDHRIQARPDGDVTRVSLCENGRLDRDVVVHWPAATNEVGVRLIEGGGLPGDDGRYGLLTITPPAAPETCLARDLTILIDASGSMDGFPLDCCKEMVLALLDSLLPEDRVEILAFSDRTRALTRGTIRARGRALRRAREAVEDLRAGGATEMTGALHEALHPLRRDSQRQVVLFTDGYIGFEDEVVGGVREGLAPGCRVHAVGVGSAPNRTLTRGVARAGRGVEVFVEDGSVADEAAQRLLQATVGPVLTEIRLDGGACAGTAIERPRDVLAGQPLVLPVTLAPGGGILQVTGRLAGRRSTWTQSIEIPDAGSIDANDSRRSPLPLGALFGREAVAEVEETHHAHSRTQVDRRVEALGLRHRIATRRTSLVAVADEPGVDPGEPSRRHVLETELPHGVSAEGVGLAGAAAPRMMAGALRARAAAEPLDEDTGEFLFEKDTGIFDMGEPPAQAGPPAERRRTVSPIDRRRAPLIARGRVLRIDDDRILIEFESPARSFSLPGEDDEVTVTPMRSGQRWVARVDLEAGTRRGPHAAGLTLRLGLRRPEGEVWPTGAVVLQWETSSGAVTIALEISGEE